MPTREDFENLTATIPEPAGARVGMPGHIGAVVDSENVQFRFAHNKIGVWNHDFNGSVNLDGPESLREGMLGQPLQMYDNPLGIIPSTLFTPTASKIPGIDIEYMELALLSSLVLGLFAEILGGRLSN